jgi:hypothetical protein
MSFDRVGSPQVYFLKPVDMDGPIKIGHSWHPKARLGSYAAWSPVALEIVLTIPGDTALETNIQQCFADCHSHREWFRAEPRLLKAIADMQAGVPVHEAIDLGNRRGKIHKFRMLDAVARKGTSQETYAL